MRYKKRLKICIINNAEPGTINFIRPIQEILESLSIKYVCIEYENCRRINLDNFDGIILSGSPQGDDIILHHSPFYKWIYDFEKPVLGICAGHHILGYIFGAKIRADELETGEFEVKIRKEDPLFQGMSSMFRVKEMHNYSITVPHEFVLLASSRTCENQIMRHRIRPVYGCQFHSENGDGQLLKNFIDLCRLKN